MPNEANTTHSTPRDLEVMDDYSVPQIIYDIETSSQSFNAFLNLKLKMKMNSEKYSPSCKWTVVK